MAIGWGDVLLHPMLLDAIRAGTCTQWTVHAVPHWECQMLQCVNCREYPVPAEEARENTNTEDILFHVYEYKVLIQVYGKEKRQLKLVQKRAIIGKFHGLYYFPAIGCGGYHTTSYMLAAQCQREQ
jgi:hypothetical protein